MPRLLLVPGSARRASLNAALLCHVAARLRGRCVTEMLRPAEVGLPLFDQDLEDDATVGDGVRALHARFAACDGIVVASPEYNGQLPPYLKNLVDWVSRLPRIDPRFDNAFLDRPVLLCSASSGWSGGALAVPHARALFGYVGAAVLGPALCVPHAGEAFDGQGFDFDPVFEQQVDDVVDRIVHAASDFALRRQSSRLRAA